MDTRNWLETMPSITNNDSFQKGNFAQCLKLALVVPLHKKNEKTNPTNYRPFSLLIAISKIIEKIIFKRIYNFMEDKLINSLTLALALCELV